MAWVSVHDNVIGGKLRELAKEIESTQEEALGVLTSLWIWGLNNADKDGRLISADKEDVLEAFSVKLVAKLAPLNIVESLLKTRWIDEPEPGVLIIHDWDQWQEQWYKAMERREKDAKRKADVRKNKPETKAPPEKGKGEDVPAEIPEDTPADNAGGGEQSKSKPPKKPKPEKIRYAEFVHMEKTEYEKLVVQFGERAVSKMIEVLDNYKGAKGKKYASDYRAILNWVVDRVREQNPGLISHQDNSTPGESPFKDWEEDE